MDAAGIFARKSTVLDRYVQIGVAGSKLLSVSFPASVDEETPTEHELLDRIEASLAGEKQDFSDVDVALTVPTDERAVLEEVRTIPYGGSVTVDAVARMTPTLVDIDEGREIVEAALRENPTPIVVPDHRVRDGPGATPDAVARRLRDIEGI
ncbi:MAG: MGMT family protein [Halanaeroarchaeum sp.]